MAATPVLQLSDVSLTFGGRPVFEGVDLVVQPGDRLALVGRNGSGKSTLMKLIAGVIAPDHGARVVPSDVQVGYLEQDPDFRGMTSLHDFAVQNLPAEEHYKVEIFAEALKTDLSLEAATASGGERRRAALVKLLAEEPDLLLLDEPTNHLDIESVLWLEDTLKASRTPFILISHDRAFLEALTKGTLWLDRGTLRRQNKGFAAFEDWRDTLWAEEDQARHKLDQKIKAEARWAVEGISARRKRNQGRVRALQDLRKERAEQVRRPDAIVASAHSTRSSGKKLVELKDVSLTLGDAPIVNHLTMTLQRGDRLAIVGPNGVGKTSLIKLMLGQIAPDAGSVSLGTQLEVAVLDQGRAEIDESLSVWENLTHDPEMRISGQADHIMVRGNPMHVAGYLKQFLFDDAQVRASAKTLSGGERARLLLARILARSTNLLVLDEPTNDLDIETLDLLQDVLGDYPGSVIFVSHDRSFIDRVATLTLAMEGQGKATLYAGGWSDMQAQRGETQSIKAEPKPTPKTEKKPEKPKAEKAKPGLSFTQKHRLAELPDVIAGYEADIAKLGAILADPELFKKDYARFEKATAALAKRQEQLAAAEEEWLELSELEEAG